MTKTKTLDKILVQFAIATHEARHGEDETPNFNEAKATILEAVNEIIGADVEPNMTDGLLHQVQMRQNALKKIQRARADKFIEGEK